MSATESLRNIALVSQSGAGKTSLAEAMLFDAGVTTRIGRVEDGNTVLDHQPEEIRRTSSVSAAFTQFEWKKHTVNLIDTPGDQNFLSETKGCMQAADLDIFVIDAVDGVKFQAEMTWEYAKEYNQACMFVINKMDRERADFQRTFDDIADTLGNPHPVAIQMPIGTEADFKGVIDLLKMKAYMYEGDGKGKAQDIPADMKDDAEMAREAMIEILAEADDELIERFLEGEELTDVELTKALKAGMSARIFAPVVCCAATANIGVYLIMNFAVEYGPNPLESDGFAAIKDGAEVAVKSDPAAPFSAFVVKTVADPYAGRLTVFRIVTGSLGGDGTFYNPNKDSKERFSQLLVMNGKDQKNVSGAETGSIVAVAKLKDTYTGDTMLAEGQNFTYKVSEPLPTLASFAVFAKNKGEEDKVHSGLTRLQEEDPSLRIERNAETKETVLSGLGNLHLDIAVEKIKRKFNVDMELALPRIAYRETVKKSARAQGRHKKQSGGHGQFGDCWIVLEPKPRGEGFEYVDATVGGSIPKQYIPAIEKGILETSARGVVAGYPFVDFKVTVDDGSFHAVDSSEMAFKTAGSLAFKKAVTEAQPVLLEPVMKVAIITPEEFMGDIMGDLNSRRGRVLGMDSAGKNQVVNAYVPMAEFQSYAPDLRSMTGGRGTYSMEFSHYDEVPVNLAEKIIANANIEKDEE